MSLREIHLLFISCAALVSGFFAAWAYQYYQYAGGPGLLLTAVTSVVLATGLIVYAIAFGRKTRGMGR